MKQKLAKKQLRKELAEALRSGKYKQGFASLRVRDEGCDYFCCLGVASDLIDPSKWAEYSEGFKFKDFTYMAGKKDSSTAFLTDKIMKVYGFTTNEGKFDFDTLPQELQDNICLELERKPEHQGLRSLSGLNDCHLPFDMIASVIEAEPKGLFVS